MISENYNYTYNVLNVNIEQGTFEVRFTPESENLSPVVLNTYLLPVSYMDIRTANNELVYATQDDVPFDVHLENTIKSIAPLGQWKKQYILQENIDQLHEREAVMIVDQNTIIVPSFNPEPPNTN